MKQSIQYIIFDVDDTLYDISTGFTAHRNGPAAWQFMVDHLHFKSLEEARQVRDEYFEKYHSTAKALTVAQQEGKVPVTAPKFEAHMLADYWAENLDFSLLGTPDPQLYKDLTSLPQTLIAFSNGPRRYVKRVLQTLGLFDFFGDERLFAVDDVLPHCKPEAEAFQKVFEAVGIQDASACLMVEDSMKNIRRSKELGLHTLLITGFRHNSESGEATKPNDAPLREDPAVDAHIETIQDMRKALPSLWTQKTLV